MIYSASNNKIYATSKDINKKLYILSFNYNDSEKL